MGQSDWEKSFVDLDKDLFSADAVKGYDVYDSLKGIVDNNSFILDFGCGKGNLVKNLRDKGHLKTFGVDPSELLLKDSEAERVYPGCLKRLNGDVLPFEDASFDVVYSSGVLHHIEWHNYPKVFSEIRRVLKPNGHFIYLEPRKSILRTLGHVFVFSPISRIMKQVKTLQSCLIAEWETYSVWLEKEAEAITMVQNSNFKLVKHNKKLLTSVVKFKAV